MMKFSTGLDEVDSARSRRNNIPAFAGLCLIDWKIYRWFVVFLFVGPGRFFLQKTVCLHQLIRARAAPRVEAVFRLLVSFIDRYFLGRSDRTSFFLHAPAVYYGLAIAHDQFGTRWVAGTDAKYPGSGYEHFGAGGDDSD